MNVSAFSNVYLQNANANLTRSQIAFWNYCCSNAINFLPEYIKWKSYLGLCNLEIRLMSWWIRIRMNPNRVPVSVECKTYFSYDAERNLSSSITFHRLWTFAFFFFLIKYLLYWLNLAPACCSYPMAKNWPWSFAFISWRVDFSGYGSSTCSILNKIKINVSLKSSWGLSS